MNVTAFDLAQRFVGTKEVPGAVSNPGILAMLQLDGAWPKDDAIPWCSAFTNYIAWLLRLPRSKSLAARSWLAVGRPLGIMEAMAANDVVILKRGGGPGADVLQAPGHVGFFAGHQDNANKTGGARLLILGGNQSDSVSVTAFRYADLLGVRRLA